MSATRRPVNPRVVPRLGRFRKLGLRRGKRRPRAIRRAAGYTAKAWVALQTHAGGTLRHTARTRSPTNVRALGSGNQGT